MGRGRKVRHINLEYMTSDFGDKEAKARSLEMLAEKYRGEWTGSGTNGAPELDMAKYLGLRPGRFSRPMECNVIFAFPDPQDAKVFYAEGRKMIRAWTDAK